MKIKNRSAIEHGTFWSIKAMAGRWKISERTIRRIIEAGDLAAHRIGGQIRCSLEDIEAYEMRNRL